jgi:FKBP-type peptidyl-prolyl cis-trans isomerase FkpA
MKQKVTSVGFVLVTVLMFTLTSCLDSNYTDPSIAFNEQFKQDTAAIGAYVRSKGLNPIYDINHVGIVFINQTNGLPPRSDYEVSINYTGKLLNETVFDSNNINLQVSKFIPGFSAGLQLMPAGSTAILLIPSVYGYGSAGAGSIPPNANLIFDVTLTSVNRTSEQRTQFASDTTTIYNYLEENSLTDSTTRDVSGLRYWITEPGTGALPGPFDRVKISYTGTLLNNGEQVINGTGQPASNFDSWVINYLQAFQVVLKKLGEGGKATVYAPSGMAFGENPVNTGANTIPANSVLIFELELTEIVQ